MQVACDDAIRIIDITHPTLCGKYRVNIPFNSYLFFLFYILIYNIFCKAHAEEAISFSIILRRGSRENHIILRHTKHCSAGNDFDCSQYYFNSLQKNKKHVQLKNSKESQMWHS